VHVKFDEIVGNYLPGAESRPQSRGFRIQANGYAAGALLFYGRASGLQVPKSHAPHGDKAAVFCLAYPWSDDELITEYHVLTAKESEYTRAEKFKPDSKYIAVPYRRYDFGQQIFDEHEVAWSPDNRSLSIPGAGLVIAGSSQNVRTHIGITSLDQVYPIAPELPADIKDKLIERLKQGEPEQRLAEVVDLRANVS
jgi:hypothetical protein